MAEPMEDMPPQGRPHHQGDDLMGRAHSMTRALEQFSDFAVALTHGPSGTRVQITADVDEEGLGRLLKILEVQRDILQVLGQPDAPAPVGIAERHGKVQASDTPEPPVLQSAVEDHERAGYVPTEEDLQAARDAHPSEGHEAAVKAGDEPTTISELTEIPPELDRAAKESPG